jgi:predicted MFS family arabinose efflux permease
LFLSIGVSIPVLPRLIERRLGGDDGDIGLMVFVYAVAAIGCRPLVARVGRSGPRLLMWSGALMSAAGMAVHAFASNLGVVSIGRVIVAIGETLLFVGFASRVTALAPEGREAEYTSVGSVAVFAALGLGPIAGEWFVERNAYRSAYLSAAVLCVVAAVVAFITVSRDEQTPAEPMQKLATQVRVFHPGALPTGAVLGLIIAAYFTWNSYIALHADDLKMASAAWVFVVFSAVTLLARLLGATLPERIGLMRAVRFAAIGVAVALAITASWAMPIGVYVGTLVMAIGLAFTYPALTALTLRATDPAERTHVLSTFTMFFEVGSGSAGLLLGPLADATNRRVAFGAGSAIALSALAATVPLASWIAKGSTKRASRT